MKLSSLAALVALANLACIPAYAQAGAEASAAAKRLFAAYWEFRLSEAPELATTVGRTDFDDRWRDRSAEAGAVGRVRRQEFLDALERIPTDRLTPSEVLSARLLRYEITRDLQAEEYLTVVERMSQMAPLYGMHGVVFSTVDRMPTRTVRDYENIVARLRALPSLVDQHIALWNEQLAAGNAQPAVVVDAVLVQLAAQLGPASSSPLLAAFRRFPDDIAPADRERLLAAATRAYDEVFVPSWTRLEVFVREIYRPKARSDNAVSALSGGRGAYDVLVRYWAETTQSAAEIHTMGLREVERIEQAMEALARGTGFEGSRQEFEQNLAARPGMRFASREEMLEYARAVMARTRPELPELFASLPRTPIDVRPIPPEIEASSATSYSPGTPDGERPAWVNLRTYMPETQVKYAIDSIVLHESLPGHHAQLGLAQELTDLPDFRRYFRSPAFLEGWALYAEGLGVEIGAYPDPGTRFGQLANELFRAVRLVVDTGLHANGWSRERAREYLAEHVPTQSPAEIDRYIALPGQALAYKVGQLKISQLRARAQAELGPKFDIREFHDAVLRNGGLPLGMLEEQVVGYIDETRVTGDASRAWLLRAN